MAAKTKTTFTKVKVKDFINSFVDNAQKKKDSFDLIELMQEWSGYKPEMWGPSIIGFGKYHYRYASGHEGDAPIIGFSPRKTALTLYVHTPGPHNKNLLDGLGKCKISKACVYAKKLDDLNLDTLEKLCKANIRYVKENLDTSNRK